jgi:hypothetical protein
MLPKDFTPDVIEDPTKPNPVEFPAPPSTEIPDAQNARPPDSPYPVHPEKSPGDVPQSKPVDQPPKS